MYTREEIIDILVEKENEDFINRLNCYKDVELAEEYNKKFSSNLCFDGKGFKFKLLKKEPEYDETWITNGGFTVYVSKYVTNDSQKVCVIFHDFSISYLDKESLVKFVCKGKSKFLEVVNEYNK